MNKFTYDSHDVSSSRAIYDASISLGMDDVVISLNGHLSIESAIATQELCDQAIALAVTGGLMEQKALRRYEVSTRSSELIMEGAESWITGKVVSSLKSDLDYHASTITYYENNPTVLTANNPYPVRTLEGELILASTLNDVKTLVTNIGVKLNYVYTAVLNSDDSVGDNELDRQIDACTTTEELDAIVDTRV